MDKPQGQPTLRHYDASYGSFEADVYAQVRREAFGEDIGQNSWLTATEQDRFLSHLNLAPGKTLLDVACGSGGPAMRIAAATGCSLVGIDSHQDAVSVAGTLAAQRGLTNRAEFHVMNAAEELPFPACKFDAITCIDAINHLPDRPRVLADWARLLKPGGRLMFTNATTVTGPLSKEEIAIRSSIGFFLFVPSGYDERVLAECGLRLLLREDVTAAMAETAERRRAARERHATALSEIEGATTYAGQQEFLGVAACLARERRLSRIAFVAEKPA